MWEKIREKGRIFISIGRIVLASSAQAGSAYLPGVKRTAEFED
jgi:hypothetical protein